MCDGGGGEGSAAGTSSPYDNSHGGPLQPIHSFVACRETEDMQDRWTKRIAPKILWIQRWQALGPHCVVMVAYA